jgi:ABC-type transport system substrate-binding protein
MTDAGRDRTRLSRRRAVRAAAIAGAGLAALSFVGCGGGDDDKQESANTGETGTDDSAKGKPGGKLVLQNSGYHFSNILIRPTPSSYTVFGLVHSGLMAYAIGRPPSNGLDVVVEPDLAEALPEQLPDQLSYRFKLRTNAQFHNGRTVTSEDVKYSLERYSFDPSSNARLRLTWLDRVDAPDATTVVVKTKTPYADAVPSMAADWENFIMAKEFEESPESATKLMGSGPFIWNTDTPPVITTFRKNPNYYLKPYPTSTR